MKASIRESHQAVVITAGRPALGKCLARTPERYFILGRVSTGVTVRHLFWGQEALIAIERRSKV